jgi:SAM-dependent methyltransferase
LHQRKVLEMKENNNSIYSGFALVYDLFMDNVPYDEWTEYLMGLLQEHNVNEGLVLELGCGTGNITRRLATKGYDMIGIDNSEEMLEIARDVEYEGCLGDEDSSLSDCSSILYLQQDMRDFELYGTVAAVVSICDSMNYITSEEELLKVFRLVNNYLDENGVFIFDMNTEYKYRCILSDNIIAENREDCSFIWENYYHEDKMLNEYDITMFVKLEDGEEQLFERFQETHYQKAYTCEHIIQLLEKAGMEFVAVYDAFTHNPPTNESERLYFIAREKEQEKKTYLKT